VKRALLTVLIAIPLIAGAAFAGGGFGLQRGPGGPGGPGDHHGRGPGGPGGPGGFGILNPRLFHQLDLTDAQHEQIRTLVEAQRTAAEPLHEQLKANHDAVRAASLTTSFDEAQVRSLIASGEALRTELALGDAKVASQVYALLTAEQRTKLAEILAQGPPAGAGRHGH
jgi:Spy/CpxP family protein refolding chaperone